MNCWQRASPRWRLSKTVQRRFPGFDQKIIALYAQGMSTRDIQVHVRALYSIDISPELITAVTDTVLDKLEAWQSRPLERVYTIVFFDRLHVTIRDGGAVKNRSVYVAIGVRCSGQREMLGIWIEHPEDARFWLRIMREIRHRGTQDVLIAVADEIKGLAEAIHVMFPGAFLQSCVVQLLRCSMQFASRKECKRMAPAVQAIFGAESASAAAALVDQFDAGPWGRKYPAIVQTWRRNWEQVIPFFAFPAAARRFICTTGAIASMHNLVRKAVHERGHFPSEEAAKKLIWLAIPEITVKWKNPPIYWRVAKAQFAAQFKERFVVTPGKSSTPG